MNTRIIRVIMTCAQIRTKMVYQDPQMVSTCGGGSRGCIYWWSRRGMLCGEEGRLLDGMVQEWGGGGV